MQKLLARLNPYARLAAIEAELEQQRVINSHSLTAFNMIAVALDHLREPINPALAPLYGYKAAK